MSLPTPVHAVDLANHLGIELREGWTNARCPNSRAHQNEDKNASFGFKEGDIRLLVKCQRGCTDNQIAAALGKSADDFCFYPIQYVYADEHGTPLYRIVRLRGGKKIAERANDKGRWVTGMKDVRRILYRLDTLQGKASVWVVEGERDVETLRRFGLIATCNPFGAGPGKWLAAFTEELIAAGVQTVAVIADNDPAGRDHAQSVLKACRRGGLRGFVVPLPGIEQIDVSGADVTDWFYAGHTLADLKAAAATAAEQDQALPAEPEAPAGHWDSAWERLLERWKNAPSIGELTAGGNARRFKVNHEEDAVYAPVWNSWVVWGKTHWEIDGMLEVQRWMSIYLNATLQDAEQFPDDPRYLAFAKKSDTPGARDQALEYAAPFMAVDAIKHFDQDPWLLNCLNGTLELQTLTFRGHRKDDRITLITNAEYHPGVMDERWDAFLLHAVPNPDTRHYLQKLFGYVLTGYRRERLMLNIFGPTGTGKTTFLLAVVAALGTYACEAQATSFMKSRRDNEGAAPRSDLARLVSKRLVFSTEAKAQYRLDEALVKQMTGGEALSVRDLYAKTFQYIPQFFWVLGGNEQAQADFNDEALWVRIPVVPFDQQVPRPEQDSSLQEYLIATPTARNAVLAWAVEGFRLYQQEGLIQPDQVCRAGRQYQESMNPLSDFLTECCVLSPGASCTRQELRHAYDDWADAAGEQRRLDAKKFTRAVAGIGGVREHVVRRKLGWVGIGMKSDDTPLGRPDSAFFGDDEQHEQHEQHESPIVSSTHGPNKHSGALIRDHATANAPSAAVTSPAAFVPDEGFDLPPDPDDPKNDLLEEGF